jgi:hypothetical protein
MNGSAEGVSQAKTYAVSREVQCSHEEGRDG